MLYRITNLWIDQYDLWADDIIGSKVRVATWDGTLVPPSNLAGFFYLGQLGPDGKIYISCINTVSYLHVIENPNERGTACNVNQLGFVLPAFNGRLIPYFPNYRLGALGPGGCDSLPTATSYWPSPKPRQLQLAPNPAGEQTRVLFDEAPQHNDYLVVYNVHGQAIFRQAAQLDQLDLTQLPAGVYSVAWWRAGERLAVTKLIRL